MLSGFFLPGIVLEVLGIHLPGPAQFFFWAFFIVLGAVIGFGTAYRIQASRHAGQRLGAWVGFDLIAFTVGMVLGFLVVLWLAFVGIVTNDVWFGVGVVGGGLFLMFGYHAFYYGVWSKGSRAPR